MGANHCRSSPSRHRCGPLARQRAAVVARLQEMNGDRVAQAGEAPLPQRVALPGCGDVCAGGPGKPSMGKEEDGLAAEKFEKPIAPAKSPRNLARSRQLATLR